MTTSDVGDAPFAFTIWLFLANTSEPDTNDSDQLLRDPTFNP